MTGQQRWPTPRAWTHELVSRKPGGPWEVNAVGSLDWVLMMSGDLYVMPGNVRTMKIRRRSWWRRWKESR